jgi:glycine betaine/choline ABC-type transport system substrate-binding protein
MVQNGTDSLIPKFYLAILKDKQQYFPAYKAIFLVRQDTLVASLRTDKISLRPMQEMNYAVDVSN